MSLNEAGEVPFHRYAELPHADPRATQPRAPGSTTSGAIGAW